MNRKILESLRSRRNTSENESVWNLFVQILLPLIFILTFIAVIDILKYRRVYHITQSENEQLKDALKDYDPRKEHFKRKVAILELQKLKLLKALEEVKNKERDTYRLSKFTSGDDVVLSNNKEIKIDDKDFKFLCNKINEKISGNHREQNQNYLNGLYQIILKKADVIDDSFDQSLLRVKLWKSTDVIPDDVEIRACKSGTISKSNRALLHNNIIGFSNDMKVELLRIQTEVLKRIIIKLIENPESVDETSNKLIKKMLETKSDEERRAFANQFYKRITGEIQDGIEKEGYIFFDETWQQMASIS